MDCSPSAPERVADGGAGGAGRADGGCERDGGEGVDGEEDEGGEGSDGEGDDGEGSDGDDGEGGADEGGEGSDGEDGEGSDGEDGEGNEGEDGEGNEAELGMPLALGGGGMGGEIGLLQPTSRAIASALMQLAAVLADRRVFSSTDARI